MNFKYWFFNHAVKLRGDFKSLPQVKKTLEINEVQFYKLYNRHDLVDIGRLKSLNKLLSKKVK